MKNTVSLNCLTASEAIRRHDVSVAEWFFTNQRYILVKYENNPSRRDELIRDLVEELHDAVRDLTSEG